MCLTQKYLTYSEIYSNEKPRGSTMRMRHMDYLGYPTNRECWIDPEKQDKILISYREEIKSGNIIAIETGIENGDFFLKLICRFYVATDIPHNWREEFDANLILFTKQVNQEAVLAYLIKKQGFIHSSSQNFFYNPDDKDDAYTAYFAPRAEKINRADRLAKII